jgi:predicted DCC family thiol-disulfide oxidoreductase YuxK
MTAGPLAAILRAWTGYWFRPAALLDLAVLRIVLVAFQLQFMARWIYREDLRQVSGLPATLFEPTLLVHLVTGPLGREPLSATTVFALYGVCMLAGVLALVGLWTRVSLTSFALGSVYLQAFLYSFGDFHHPEAVVHIALVALALGPAGAVLSLDDLRRRLRRNAGAGRFEPFDPTRPISEDAAWPRLLIIWVLSLVYFSAGLSKVTITNGLLVESNAALDWLNGFTLQWILVRDGLLWNNPLGVWVAQFHGLALLLSWGTVAVELLFPLVIVFPRLALPLVGGAAMMHLGIYVLQWTAFFQYYALYFAFFPIARWTAWAAERARRRWPGKLEVLYDGRCPLCIRSATALQYFDVLDRLGFTDLESVRPGEAELRPGITREQARREMHLVAPDGSTWRGFFAARRALWQLPLLWPALPLLYLPGASRLGPVAYRAVASRRARIECDADTCALHEL